MKTNLPGFNRAPHAVRIAVEPFSRVRPAVLIQDAPDPVGLSPNHFPAVHTDPAAPARSATESATEAMQPMLIRISPPP